MSATYRTAAFIIVAALILYLLAWIITEQLPRILGLLAF